VGKHLYFRDKETVSKMIRQPVYFLCPLSSGCSLPGFKEIITGIRMLKNYVKKLTIHFKYDISVGKC